MDRFHQVLAESFERGFGKQLYVVAFGDYNLTPNSIECCATAVLDVSVKKRALPVGARYTSPPCRPH